MKKTTTFALTLTILLVGCAQKPKTQPTAVQEEVVTPSPAPVVTEPVKVEEVAIPQPQPTSEPVMSNYSVDATEAHQMIQDDPDIFILDVRTPAEIPMDGRIANSTMIPLQILGQSLGQLDTSKRILVYCHTGNRSLIAMQILSDNGFTVVDMAGGISSWTASGFPVER